jgi:hypothetical protein
VTATILTLLVLPAITRVVLGFGERRKARPADEGAAVPAE